jgi:hypothetical protein
VILDTVARQTVDSAILTWAGAELAWAAIEWTLSHDAYVGVPLNEGGSVRAFLYDGARSICHPDVEVTYEICPHEIIVRRAVFRDARLSFSGRG